MIIWRARLTSWVLAGLALALALGSCGKVAEEEELQIDSNTNWLERCESDDVCSGSLRCYCGQCTRPCSQNDECSLLEGAECAPSGSPVCEDGASAGGLCVLACTGDDACGFDFTCTEGQCVPRPCRVGTYTWDDVFEAVAADLGSLDADDALFARYVSQANRWSSAPCDWSITAEAQAVSKLVNSLSNDASITAPLAIDRDGTLFRIDLRDYGWDLLTVVDGVPYSDGWEALIANNPYALPFVGADADDAVADTGTVVPVMFANAFIATATRPDVYYALARVPERLEVLLDDFGFQGGVVPPTPSFQAGFVANSGVEFIARQFELQVRPGYLWQITELGREPGALLREPLAAPLGESEIVFTLPNGFHAFAYMSSTGERINDWAALVDDNQSNGQAVAPRTHFRRHDPGVNVTDQVRDFVLANPGNFQTSVSQLIQQRYPGPSALAAQLDRDLDTFTQPALRAASIAIAAPDPITRSLDQFQEVTLEEVAGDLLVTAEELRNNLGLLEPALRVLSDRPVPREAFTELYADSMCKLGVLLENQPDPSYCPP
jgi:hypothetical protein